MNSAKSLSELTALAAQIRRDIVRMVARAESGHPGGSLGCVEYFVALYGAIMHYSPQPFDISGANQDVFILSNGHISPVLYATLARSGFFDVDELNTFRLLNSRLQGHPSTHAHLPGVHVATGSLGQGLSVGVGMALAKRLTDDLRTVYVLTGDGELQEGQIWEAAMFAAHNKVDNLIVTVDLNYKQIDGDTRDVLDTRSLAAKWRAFGWEVLEQPQGNDLPHVLDTLRYAGEVAWNGKPVVVLLETLMGKGVDYMEHTHKWHGVAPNAEQLALALAQLPETLGDF
jgi:transketolase